MYIPADEIIVPILASILLLIDINTVRRQVRQVDRRKQYKFITNLVIL